MFWKKGLCCVIIMVLLCGCGASASTQEAIDLRTNLLEAGGCSFEADIRADLGQRAYEFSVSCDYTAGKEAKITVLQPEEIAGIAATVTDGKAVVEFDGMALDFGPLAGGNLSAMEGVFLLPQCWTGAYISAAGDDGEFCRVTYLHGYDEKELTVDTWISEDGNPFRGEIFYDGVRCLTFDITQFQLKG